MVDAGLFEDLMSRIDHGTLQLTGEGGCARQVFETVCSLFFGYAATGSWSRAWWLANAVAGGRPPALRLGRRRLYQLSM